VATAETTTAGQAKGTENARMSNIAGKAYAMNLVTPLHGYLAPLNKLFFWLVGTPLFKSRLRGLLTLSMIHYARWVILAGDQFPRGSDGRPGEDPAYSYMFFFSNFNGTWEQYVDSFSAAIPSGLDLLWFKNVGWPNAVPELPFHAYVQHNQITTDYYYNAYPMAASNDVKSAKKVKDSLEAFVSATRGVTPADFLGQYHRLLKSLQNDISPMDASPIVSLASEAIARRRHAGDRSDRRAPVHPS
jgi:hypothetical protein